MKRRRWVLLNPGPVNVTPRVRQALSGPDLCHRENEFSDLLISVRHRLLSAFGISKSHQAVFFTGSGTTALESMLVDACAAGKTLLLSNGVYGERIASILRIHGLPFETLAASLGDFPGIEAIDGRLKRDPSIRRVAMVHHETSTGMLNPLADVGRIVKKRGRTLVVDAISSLGAEEIDFQNLPIAYLAGTSGKCLHGFPGISFVLLSKIEAARPGPSRQRSLSLDLRNALSYQDRGDVPFTPAVQLFYAFDQALSELASQGVRSRIASYRKKSSLLAGGFTKLGLEFLVPETSRSHVLTALWTPAGISYDQLHDGLKKDGFVIYAGQSKLKDRIFRVSNLGDISESDLRRFLNALRRRLGRAR